MQASTPRDIFLGTVIVLKLRERQRRRISERYEETMACLRILHSVTWSSYFLETDITKPRNSETKYRNSETPKRNTETSEVFFSFFLDQRNLEKKNNSFHYQRTLGRDRGVFLIVNLHEVNSICLP